MQNTNQQNIQQKETQVSQNFDDSQNAANQNNIDNPQNVESNSFGDKFSRKIAEGYAKILGKKKFKKDIIQDNDDQIVTVVQEVYKHPENRLSEVGDRILDENESFLFHAAYKHRTENRVLICYRGTDFKNMKDLFSDVQIVLGVNGIDDRVRESLQFFDKIQMKYPQAEKWICGHSLGGTISYVVTKHRAPKRCIVFNPGASATKSMLGMMNDTIFKKEWTKSITTYKILGDVISTLSFVGNVKVFLLKSANPLKLHSIDSFPELFNEEKEKQQK